MATPRPKLILFYVLLLLFSANFIFLGLQKFWQISALDFFKQYPALKPFAATSQYLRVYDSPTFFYTANIISKENFKGQTKEISLERTTFTNSLDHVLFIRAFYWIQNERGIAQKEKLLQLAFCDSETKTISWKMYYVDHTLLWNLGQVHCPVAIDTSSPVI